RPETTAPEVSTHLRNKAERTRTIAAFGDLHKCVVRRRREHAWRRIVVEICRTLIAKLYDRQRTRVCLRVGNGQDVVDLAGTDECVDFRYLGFQFITITLHQAAGDDQSLRLSVCF